jgi:hypothetical protein
LVTNAQTAIFKGAASSSLDLSNGLFIQAFIWSGALGSNITWSNISVTVTGSAFEIPLGVAIAVNPGSYPAPINPGSNGVVPVAVLGTVGFDVTTVDPSTLTFGPTGVETTVRACNIEDVNNDGQLDLVCQFLGGSIAFQAGDRNAVLRGKTTNGIPILGTEQIVTVPPVR